MDNTGVINIISQDRVRRDAFLDQARVRLEQDQPQLAMEMAEARLKRLPGDADARVILCHALTNMGRFDEAREILREAEEIILGFSKIYAVMGDFSLKKGLREDAVMFYRKFLALNPQDAPETREVAGKMKALLAGGDVDELPDEESPLRVDEIFPDFYTVTLAELYINQGHPDMAQAVLEKVLEKEPGNGIAQARLREIQALYAVRRQTGQPGWHARRIGVLSRWLKNLEGMRAHAT